MSFCGRILDINVAFVNKGGAKNGKIHEKKSKTGKKTTKNS